MFDLSTYFLYLYTQGYFTNCLVERGCVWKVNQRLGPDGPSSCHWRNTCEPMSFRATREPVTALPLMLHLEQTGLDEISDFQGTSPCNQQSRNSYLHSASGLLSSPLNSSSSEGQETLTNASQD